MRRHGWAIWRGAIGARVSIKTGDFVQIGEIQSGGSYMSQNDLRLHFGLGQHTKIDVVEIRWPSGRKEEIWNLQGDFIYSIDEGLGVRHQTKLRDKKLK